MRKQHNKYFDGQGGWVNGAVRLPTRFLGTGQAVAWVYEGALPPAQSARETLRPTAVGYDRAFNRKLTTVDITVGTATTGT